MLLVHGCLPAHSVIVAGCNQRTEILSHWVDCYFVIVVHNKNTHLSDYQVSLEVIVWLFVALLLYSHFHT